MDDHPSNENANGQDGLEPTTNTPEANRDDRTVPLRELVEMRQELRATREELERLKAGASKNSTESPASPKAAKDSDLASTVRELKRDNLLRDLRTEHGLANSKQATAVADILDSMPGLKPEEAKSIAQGRFPDLFKEVDASGGFNEAVHGSSRPRSVSHDPEPKKSDFQERAEHITARFKGDKQAGMRAWNNWVGSFAAKEIGMTGHRLIPLPKRN